MGKKGLLRRQESVGAIGRGVEGGGDGGDLVIPLGLGG
jgi:hypothetical protein